MQRIQGWVEKGNQPVVSAGVSSATDVQRSYPQGTVTVYVSGSLTLAVIYADNLFTPLSNPFQSDTDGHYFFYSLPAHLDIQLSGGGLSSPYTIGDVQVSGTNYEVNVKDLGAVGDGIADDTAAFVLAFSKSSYVFIPPGRYKLTNTINLPNSAYLRGSGRELVTLALTHNNIGFNISGNTVLKHHTLCDVSIVTADGFTTPQAVMVFPDHGPSYPEPGPADAEDLNFDRLYFQAEGAGRMEHAIYFENNVYMSAITDCSTRSVVNPVYIGVNANANTIVNPDFGGSSDILTGIGIDIYGSQDCSVYGGTVECAALNLVRVQGASGVYAPGIFRAFGTHFESGHGEISGIVNKSGTVFLSNCMIGGSYVNAVRSENGAIVNMNQVLIQGASNDCLVLIQGNVSASGAAPIITNCYFYNTFNANPILVLDGSRGGVLGNNTFLANNPASVGITTGRTVATYTPLISGNNFTTLALAINLLNVYEPVLTGNTFASDVVTPISVPNGHMVGNVKGGSPIRNRMLFPGPFNIQDGLAPGVENLNIGRDSVGNSQMTISRGSTGNYTSTFYKTGGFIDWQVGTRDVANGWSNKYTIATPTNVWFAIDQLTGTTQLLGTMVNMKLAYMEPRTVASLSTVVNPAPGLLCYVSDGTPATNPLVGGGPGCLALYASGGWVGK